MRIPRSSWTIVAVLILPISVRAQVELTSYPGYESKIMSLEIEGLYSPELSLEQLHRTQNDIHFLSTKIAPEKAKGLAKKLHTWREEADTQMIKLNPNYDPKTDLWAGH
mgnify:CR=1 FL=1